ncbi:unnamed protein product [Prunus armeniaca]|uniref:Uncharacterized protein n=1 Tax=Prunus armeniaca TaxID=36596 RepID=A0A6J5TGL8_PRUAR|nr:unnamed protein product [Prunus armeniaca]
MTTSPVKDQMRDFVEKEIDNAHKVVDAITSPIAPLDGVVHGVARGIFKPKCAPNNHGGNGRGGSRGGNGDCNSGGIHNTGGNQTGNTSGNNTSGNISSY